jgi:DNA polymerase elongation subunit (family B)
MLSGSILDVYPDNHNNVMVTWLVDEGKSIRIEDVYKPSFFVYSKVEDLYNLAVMLRDLPDIENLNFTRKKIVIGSDKRKLVLEVLPKKISLISKLAGIIDSWGGFHRYQLFNVDIRLPSRYLQDKGVFFNARVKWNGKKFFLDDEQWAIDYTIPSYNSIFLDIKRRSDSSIMSFNDYIESIRVGDYVIREKSEVDTILLAVKQIKHVDPDIVYTYKGDSVLLPFLYHRAKINNVQSRLNLGRDENSSLRPIKQAKSYFSYGQIVYRPAFYTLLGRSHIDTYNSFLYG